MRRQLNKTTIAILAMVFPIAAWANLTGTQILTGTPATALSLDTGTSSVSGGDILWNGTNLTPQGAATIFNLPSSASGMTSFNALTQSALSAFTYSTSPIPASSLTVNDIFAVKTNGGNYAAAIVTATSGGSITLQYITFEASSGPNITQVLNNFGLIPAGFSNSGIAPGSLFLIKGSGLASATAQAVLQSSSGSGLPLTLNGSSVKVTVSGTTVVPAFYYATATQLALVLPSTTLVGSGTITVTNGTQTSAAFPIQVVASAFGFDSYYETGSGLGVATSNANGNVFNYNNSIPTGSVAVLWGSGLGADPSRDTTYNPPSPPFPINSLASVYVGGVPATINYQGASGFPGVNQIDITIPANAPTGCNVSVVGVTAAGVPTNSITLPIGTGGPCSDPAFGTSGAQFETLSGQQNVRTGFVALSQSTSTSLSGTTTNAIAIADFQSVTGSVYGTASGSVSIGGCVVNQGLGSGSSTSLPTGLNAGVITLTGPNGTALLNSTSQLPGFYSSSPLAAGFIPAGGGTFTVSGTGTTVVGSFNTTIVYPSTPLTWTNQSAAASVTRSAGLPVTWTGGTASTYVIINGSSSAGTSFAGFTCIAPTSADQFTVPAYVLAALPAGNGSVTVANYTDAQSFTATGLDYGYSAGFISFSTSATFN